MIKNIERVQALLSLLNINTIFRNCLSYLLIINMPRISRKKIRVISVVALVIIFFFDYITGYEVNITFAYLVPIFLITQSEQLHAGLIMSLACAIIRKVSDYLSGEKYTHTYYYAINCFSSFVTFAIYTAFIDLLYSYYIREKDIGLIDELTKITNRKGFFEKSTVEFLKSKANDSFFNLAIIDIDNFKSVNDSYGHLEGDDLLCKVANTIKDNTRTTDIAARIGGDEFAVVFVGANNEIAAGLSKKLHLKINEECRKKFQNISCSIGISFCKPTQKSLTDFYKDADDALYSAKKKGKNNVFTAGTC